MAPVPHRFLSWLERFAAFQAISQRIGPPLTSHSWLNSSEKRLARTLLLLARYKKQQQPDGILPLVSQETLAGMIGTTRSRVNFFMNKFGKLGFIEYNGKIKVNKSLLTVVLHE
jgi:CRP/FNR family transcriptional regulator, cyclic AMP receptor protein